MTVQYILSDPLLPILLSDMCINCSELPLTCECGENDCGHVIRDWSREWEWLTTVYRPRLSSCNCCTLGRERSLSESSKIHPNSSFHWKITLHHTRYRFFNLIQIGIGQSDGFGLVRKQKDHFICENGKISWKREDQQTAGMIQYLDDPDSLPCCPVAQWFSAESLRTKFPAILLGHNEHTSVKSFRNVSDELFPIAVVGTEYGIINLIETCGVLTLQNIAAQRLTSNMKNIESLK